MGSATPKVPKTFLLPTMVMRATHALMGNSVESETEDKTPEANADDAEIRNFKEREELAEEDNAIEEQADEGLDTGFSS
ncbi:hypothetical protein SUGI_0468420 [Cryptomeria japonica]|nr:hypothetical protein SUGI_0468420 [Cryptomeria japonica]